MDLRNKILLERIRNIIWFILLWCAICMGILTLVIIANSVIRGDKIEKPMGPAHNWTVPKDTTVYENENILYWEWDSDNIMDSVNMDCGGEYHGKEGESEYGEYVENNK